MFRPNWIILSVNYFYISSFASHFFKLFGANQLTQSTRDSTEDVKSPAPDLQANRYLSNKFVTRYYLLYMVYTRYISCRIFLIEMSISCILAAIQLHAPSCCLRKSGHIRQRVPMMTSAPLYQNKRSHPLDVRAHQNWKAPIKWVHQRKGVSIKKRVNIKL